MASPLSWLCKCTSTQLKGLAKAIGINSSGTKSLLTSQLLHHLPRGTFSHQRVSGTSPKPCNILSIDLGIRNLAYCLCTLPLSLATAQPGQPACIGAPIIREWTRIAVSQRPKDIEALENSKAREAFDPATYSQYAYDLVTALLKDSEPTHILIERQRFRSMGGSAVQEWTLRVNMFEAMIYAVLKTYTELGAWRGSVYPIAPAKVSKFWLGEKEGVAEGGKGSKSTKTKTAKIDLVGKWLEEGDDFELTGRAAEMGKAYLRKRQGEKRTVVKEEHMSGSEPREREAMAIAKLDDLADCLLQCMAWIKWEENRKRIMAHGLKALGDV